MLAILQVSDTNTIFRQPKIHSQRISLPSGDAVFTVTTNRHLGRIPWKNLENCLGILRKNILLPDGIAVPPDINIIPFIPDVLPRLLLINSAADILKERHYQSLVLYDEKCIYTDYAESLINSFDRIRVVTPSPDKYSRIALKLMENYGFSLEVSSAATFDSEVIISHSCCVPLYYTGTVFANEKKYLMNAEVFSGSEISLPDFYENLRPENTDTLLFASALYEKCSVTELGTLKYKDFDC